MKRKLLIVDDETYILDLLSDVFKIEGYEVFCALNGEQAIEMLRDHSFEVVITDLIMPKMGGIKLFHEIKKVNPFAQIIIITGYPTLQGIAELFEAGASDFLLKPFPLALIKSLVKGSFDRIDRWYALREEWTASRDKNKAKFFQ